MITSCMCGNGGLACSRAYAAQATLPPLPQPFPPFWRPDDDSTQPLTFSRGIRDTQVRSTLAAVSLQACQDWLRQDIPKGHA